MDTYLVLTVGIVLSVLTVPSLISGWVEQRLPKIALVTFSTAVGMIFLAVMQSATGYSLTGLPDVMLGVFGRFAN